MKKLSLICAVAIAGLSLAACGNSSSKKNTTSKQTSSKVVKKHHKTHVNKKKASSRSSSAANSSSQQANQQQQTQTSSSEPDAWRYQQQTRDQAARNNTPTSEAQARAMLGGANGDLQATRTSNGWTFSGDGYTATVNDNGTITHN